MNKMNILLLMPYGSVGGMERVALTFYNYYKSQGHTVNAVKLIKLESDIINFGEDEYSLSTIDFAQMSKVSRLFYYLKAPFRIRKIIKKGGITHSISFGDMTNIFSSLTFTKEFKIGSIHSLKSIELTSPTLFNKICKLSYKLNYKNFNKVVCISKAIKEDLIQQMNYRLSNLDVIYNPHDIKEIIKLSEIPIDLKNEIDIYTKDVIVFLGRLSKEKAPWYLLNAFSKIEKDVNLVFIGDGNPEVMSFLTKQIKDLGLEHKVFFLGRKSNPYKYINAAKVLALSSYYEGTPNVIVEAIAIGTPIVSTNSSGGILELMSNGKKVLTGNNIVTESGIITPNVFEGTVSIPFKNRSIPQEKDMARALLQVLSSNKIKESLKKERKNLLKKFNVEIVANQYVSN